MLRIASVVVTSLFPPSWFVNSLSPAIKSEIQSPFSFIPSRGTISAADPKYLFAKLSGLKSSPNPRKSICNVEIDLYPFFGFDLIA